MTKKTGDTVLRVPNFFYRKIQSKSDPWYTCNSNFNDENCINVGGFFKITRESTEGKYFM